MDRRATGVDRVEIQQQAGGRNGLQPQTSSMNTKE
jgi:hypothetical protein